jgi:hemerythrin-like metal-binding protein
MLVFWTDNLSVGVKEFDDDHKRLIKMLNELHHVAKDGEATGYVDKDEIEIALHRLENYTKGHCAREEALLAKTHYPELEEHKQEHRQLLVKVADMTLRFRNSTDPRHATEIMQCIFDWVINHIYGADKKYASHLNAQPAVVEPRAQWNAFSSSNPARDKKPLRASCI